MKTALSLSNRAFLPLAVLLPLPARVSAQSEQFNDAVCADGMLGTIEDDPAGDGDTLEPRDIDLDGLNAATRGN